MSHQMFLKVYCAFDNTHCISIIQHRFSFIQLNYQLHVNYMPSSDFDYTHMVLWIFCACTSVLT